MGSPERPPRHRALPPPLHTREREREREKEIEREREREGERERRLRSIAEAKRRKRKGSFLTDCTQHGHQGFREKRIPLPSEEGTPQKGLKDFYLKGKARIWP